MKRSLVTSLFTLFLIGLVLPVASLAQEAPTGIDKSRIPAAASEPQGFVPPGWKIEEQVVGDLNNDSLPDYALKLVEDKPAKSEDDSATERQRALVILLKNREGQLASAAVADKLLQCTRCGGAFYGVAESSANVKIEKGVLVVNQDHGSRNVTEATYRFRYEAATGKFALIGLDVTDNDRATGEWISESTNYLTGVKIIKSGKGKRSATSRKQVSRKKIYIEEVDHESYEDVG